MSTGEVIEPARAENGDATATRGKTVHRSRAEIQQWLTEYLGFLLDEKPDAVNIQLTFDSHGIDSAAAVSLAADLEDWLGLELDPTIVYDYPSVPELTNHLASRQERATA